MSYDPHKVETWIKQFERHAPVLARLVLLGLLNDPDTCNLLQELHAMTFWERGNALAELAQHLEGELGRAAKLNWSVARLQEAQEP